MHRQTLAAVLLLLPALFAPASRVEAGVNVWTPIGPDGGAIVSLEAHPTRGNIVYAGTDGGVFKSTDRGSTWRLASRGLQNLRISALAAAPSNGAVVYAGTSRGLYVSNDGGASWRPAALPARLAVLALDVDPRDARRVWVGSSNGVYRSRDGGATWLSSDPDLFVHALVVDPLAPETVYVAGWKRTGFESGEMALLKTADGGATWEPRMDGLDAELEEHFNLAVDPTASGVVYASLLTPYASPDDPESTYRSTDGGVTWQLTEGGFPLVVDRYGTVYAGGRRSQDRGQTWTPVASPPEHAQIYAVSSGSPAIWAATQNDGVLRSLDRGASWQGSSRGLHATSVYSLAIDPQRPRIIYAAAAVISAGLRAFRTRSAGVRWEPIDAFRDDGVERGFSSVPHIALSPQEPRTVYVAWRSALGFARSDDGGTTWTALRERDENYILGTAQILADPTDADIVYLLGRYVAPHGEICGLARSTDRGATFQCMSPFTNALSSSYWTHLFAEPARPGRLWMPLRRGQFWRSDDHGTTWTAIRPRGLERAGAPASLAFDPALPDRLYLTTRHQEQDDRPERVWSSDDGGLTWRAWGTGIPERSAVGDLVIDPRQPNFQYAVVQHFDPTRPELNLSGVYWSRNGGRTWFPLVNGLPRNVTRLLMDPKNPRQLYVATSSLGIYAFTRQ